MRWLIIENNVRSDPLSGVTWIYPKSEGNHDRALHLYAYIHGCAKCLWPKKASCGHQTSSGWYTMEYVSKKTISALFYSSWLRIVSIFKLSNQSYRLKPYSSLYSAVINSQVFTLSFVNASPLSNSAIVFAFCIHMGSLCRQNCTSHLISNDR